METILGIQQIHPAPSCVAFGVFDGVHLGHRAVLRRVTDHARAAGVRSVVMTFDPHPDAVLARGAPPLLLTTLREKAEAIESGNGPDVLLVARFDRDLAAMEAERFVREVLVAAIGARCVVVGPDAAFGRRGEGDFALLRRMGESLGMRTVEQVGPVVVGGREVSSSAIRALLLQGDVASAREALGRPYAMGGDVVRGSGRGRSLGFPTLNLEPDRDKLIPAQGVYACWAAAGKARWQAAVSIGERATFGEPGLAVEAHLLDFSGDLYGQRAVLTFQERLRDQQRFESPEALQKQMIEDCERTRDALGQGLQGE